MAIPKRQYIATVKRGRTTKYGYGVKLKEALAVLRLKAGERFTYRVFEGGNSVECECRAANPLRYAEAGK